MRLVAITPEGYRSIKEPVRIDFCRDLPTVLVGKNGSGKTNILSALEWITQNVRSEIAPHGEGPQGWTAELLLSTEDLAELFPGRTDLPDGLPITVRSGENGRIGQICSKELTALLHEERDAMTAQANALERALDSYEQQLAAIAGDDDEIDPVHWFAATDHRSLSTNYSALCLRLRYKLDLAREMADAVQRSFSDEEDAFSLAGIDAPFGTLDAAVQPFRLTYVEPQLAAFEKRYVAVDRTNLRRQIARINQKTAAACVAIDELWNALTQRMKGLCAALSNEQISFSGDGALRPLVCRIRAAIGRRCLFLRSENSAVIFKENEGRQLFDVQDASHTILAVYLRQGYRGDDKEERLRQLEKREMPPLSDEDIDAFTAYLRGVLPQFEQGMIRDITVERTAQGGLSILLHENTGDTVPLDRTSAGRRWYFTFLLMKNTLSDGDHGDLFLIDEPAAALHPLAQKAVREELCALKKAGVEVVFTTHSPYLIPNEQHCVRFVTMTDGGTAVAAIEDEEQMAALRAQIGCDGDDVFSLQELVDRYERNAMEAARRCYYALIKKFSAIDAAASAVGYGEETLEKWKKRKRRIVLKVLIKVSELTGVPVKELIG